LLEHIKTTKFTFLDHVISSYRKEQLPQGNHSDEVYRTAARLKKICMENLYCWKTMDEDILSEAEKMVKNDLSK